MNLKKYLNRNLLLVLAVLLGIIFPKFSVDLKLFTFWILAFVMLASLTAISNKALSSFKKLIKPMLIGVILNHVVFGFFAILSAYIFSFDINLFYGFIIIAATPPGVAIIPFTAKLNGNIEYSIIATFGAFLASVFLSPLIIKYFSGSSAVNSFQILKSMVLLILVPFALSRLLLFEKIKPTLIKTRGTVVDIGFSLIIYTSVGLNSHVFYNDLLLLGELVLTFLVIMFFGGKLVELVLKNKINNDIIIADKLIFSIKSSGFAVVTSIQVFGNEAAVPATVMSVMVLVYLLFQMAYAKVKK